MPATTRTIVNLVPVFSGPNDCELIFVGVQRNIAVTVRPDESHQPKPGEDQRWQLVIDVPTPANGKPRR